MSSRLICSRCGADVARSYEPGRCYVEDNEPRLMHEHDEAVPAEEADEFTVPKALASKLVTKAEAIAAAEAVHECRVIVELLRGRIPPKDIDAKLHELEMAYFKRADELAKETSETMSDFDTQRCYSGAFHPTSARCTRRGKWTTRLGTSVDSFVWCDEHKPSDEWAVPLSDAAGGEGKEGQRE